MPADLFQGLEDKVVPPNQAEMMADAVRKKGLPVAYVRFAGRAARLPKGGDHRARPGGGAVFLRQVFGFAPADTIEPVPIENLK